MRRCCVSWLLLAAIAMPMDAAAQKAVVVLRHAENERDALTETGLAQARRLVDALGGTPVGAVYSTDTARTIRTATPLAEGRKLKVVKYDTAAGPDRFDARPFVAQLRKDHPNDVVVVVGHVTTIPDLLKALGGAGDVAIAPLDYTTLYIVVPKDTGPAVLVRVKY